MHRLRSNLTVAAIIGVCSLTSTAAGLGASADAGTRIAIVGGLLAFDDGGITPAAPGTVTGGGEQVQGPGSGEGTDSAGTSQQPSPSNAYREVRNSALTRMETFLRDAEDYRLRELDALVKTEMAQAAADPVDLAVSEFEESFSVVRALLDADKLAETDLNDVTALVTTFINAAETLSSLTPAGIASRLMRAFLSTGAFDFGLALFQSGPPEGATPRQQRLYEARMAELEPKTLELQKVADKLAEMRSAGE